MEFFCSVVRHQLLVWDDHHYCPKCRDNLKGDDPCANSSDCAICSSFCDEQKRKITNRNKNKSKKNQNSASLLDNGGKKGTINDSCWTKMSVCLKDCKIWNRRTLKLPAVKLAPAGTEYMLLGNLWRNLNLNWLLLRVLWLLVVWRGGR